ncbi:S1 RNA-binding domain-containing protein [Candidatus Daviesbacteria bacterium]|nr:S1 RNA-binding domain-containing protein [Candidatus Daviesbacteria bacterium]
MTNMTMAELLAKQDFQPKFLKYSRGQEIEGKVVALLSHDIILDLGTKSEGVLPKKELGPNILESIKLGSRLKVFVIQTENESGQVVLSSDKPTQQSRFDRSGQAQSHGARKNLQWKKFEDALKSGVILKGIGMEVNKGGLVVEVDRTRGFLPSSQVTLSQAADLDKLIGRELELTVIEVDPNQNRLIFSQKTNISEDIKSKLTTLKIGDTVEGSVAAILPFGIFVTIEGPDFSGVEGLVHISEVSWEKQEDISSLFKVGDSIKAKILSVDNTLGRVSLSIKQLLNDPFVQLIEKFQADDIVKGKISKISAIGVNVDLGEGIIGLIHSSKMEGDTKYQVGQEITCMVDSVDSAKRKINLAPFITTTKGLIYK